MISRASSVVAASGFSTSTWTPAAASSRTAGEVLLGRARRPPRSRARRRAVEQLADRGVDERRVVHRAVAVAAGVDGAGEAHARDGLEEARVVAADHAQAEHRAARAASWSGATAPTRVSAMAADRRPRARPQPRRDGSAATSRSAPHVVVHDGVVHRRRRLDPGRRHPRQAAVLSPRSTFAPPIDRGRWSSRPARGSARRRSSSPARASGPSAIVGDQAYVRERTRIGAGSIVGQGSTRRQRRGRRRARAHPVQVYLTAYIVVEDDVFVGPGAMTTNDDTMGRLRPATSLRGPTLRRACRIGGGADAGARRRDRRGGVRRRRRGRHRPTSRRARVVMGVPARVVRHVGQS